MSEERSVAILGATGGLGRALSRRLAEAGVRLTLGGRNATALESLASELDAAYLTVEATDFARVDELLDLAAGRIRVSVARSRAAFV